jgi:hypothetical protein
MPKKGPLDLAVLAELLEFLRTPHTKEELEQAFTHPNK